MRVAVYARLVFVGLLAVAFSGCGTCPNLCYEGRLKTNDMAFIRERVVEKKVDLNDTTPHPLAGRFIFAPLYLGARGIATCRGPENVTQTGKTESTYVYTDMDFIGFPLTVWADMVLNSYSENGDELSHSCFKGFFVGILGSGGGFRFESRKRVPATIGGSAIYTGMGVLPAAVYPSRWYFTGTKGSYWNAPMFLFGHVSSDTSSTFHLLGGLIPIRYSNREKPGNL